MESFDAANRVEALLRPDSEQNDHAVLTATNGKSTVGLYSI